jgi:hypothetical protein
VAITAIVEFGCTETIALPHYGSADRFLPNISKSGGKADISCESINDEMWFCRAEVAMRSCAIACERAQSHFTSDATNARSASIPSTRNAIRSCVCVCCEIASATAAMRDSRSSAPSARGESHSRASSKENEPIKLPSTILTVRAQLNFQIRAPPAESKDRAGEYSPESLCATIRRDQLFNDGGEVLKKFRPGPMHIELAFKGEVGFGSGLTHKFMVLVSMEIARRDR